MTEDEWKEQMADIDAKLLGQMDSLWSVVQPDFLPRDTRLEAQIWNRLQRQRRPLSLFLQAWLRSWFLLPIRRIGALAIGLIIVRILAQMLPVVGNGRLSWWGLLSPAAALLTVPLLNRVSGSSLWAEWESAAPLDAGTRIALDWFLIMVAMTVIVMVGDGRPVTAWERFHVALMWSGPFGLTSITAVMLMRRFGAIWAIGAASAFWAIQIVVGSVALLRHQMSWALWFGNVHTSFWPDVAAVVVGLALAGYLGERGRRLWISN